jgi:DNA-binding response OmpR family regulator
MATVLIVDDDPEMVDMMRMVLEAHDYDVRQAQSAADGFESVEQDEPDLIILDVMMESLGAGFEMARKLRRGKHKNVPILMVTGVGDETGIEFNPEKDRDYMPVDDYVEKPVKPDDLLERVGRLLGET